MKNGWLFIIFFIETLIDVDRADDIHRGQLTIQKSPKLSGFRVEPMDQHDAGFLGYTPQGLSIVEPDAEMLVVIMGYWLDDIDLIGFTLTDNCSDTIFDVKRGEHMVRTEKRLIFKFSFNIENSIFKTCVKPISAITPDGNAITSPYYLIDEPEFHVTTVLPPRTFHFPPPFEIGILIFLLILSGLFSGLSLGLMALSPSELELISKSGTEAERKYAKKIIPIRKSGNFLLCSLLIGNVFVNSSISILFDDLTSGFVALIVSSLGIVIFGEIVPQSVCVKKGLQVGAHTVWVTKFFMMLTSPISYPISKILDCLLGEEVFSYDRKRLIELIKMSAINVIDLAEELKIAVGAMEISDKTVGDVMTKINDVFMLNETTVLNPKTINEILRMGYTRIPIYSGDRNNVVSLLFVKDLALIDPDDNFTVKTVCDFHKHKLRLVMADMSLRALLEEFKKGEYHLAMIQRRTKDPDYLELVGLITLEDIVEEILQAEIVDESDVIVDNVNRTKRLKRKESKYLPALFENDSNSLLISTQMQMVTMQWLKTNHSAFHSDLIAQSVLEKLIRQHVRGIEISTEELDPSDVVYNPATRLYTKKTLSNKFILILEGRVNVTIGESAMTFEAGPWYCFGTEVLDSVLKLIRKHKENQENEKFQDIGFIDTARSLGGRDPSPLKKIRDGSFSGREVSLTRRDLSGTRRDGSLSKLGEFSNRHSLESEARRISFVPDYTAVITEDCTFLEITATSYVLAYKTSLISFEKHY